MMACKYCRCLEKKKHAGYTWPVLYICKMNENVYGAEMPDMCKNDYQNCSEFKRGIWNKIPGVDEENANRNSSGGAGSLVMIVIVVAVITKLIGIW